jgi:hypothetical protein
MIPSTAQQLQSKNEFNLKYAATSHQSLNLQNFAHFSGEELEQNVSIQCDSTPVLLLRLLELCPIHEALLVSKLLQSPTEGQFCDKRERM